MKRIGKWQPDLNIYGEKKLQDNFTDEMILFGELFAFEKGEFIFETGDIIDSFYIFLSGSGKVYMIRENGRVLLLEFYKPYQAIGDLEFITDALGSTEVECTSDSILLRFPMSQLKEKAWEYPPLLRFIISELGRKLHNASVSRSDNQLMPLKERILLYITKQSKNGFYVMTAKQSEMAEYFGVSERHFRRVLKELESDHIIQRNRSKITII
jgi:CRP-like cAMP-binding protein